MKTHNHNLFSFFVSVLAVALLSSPVRADDKKDDDKNNKKGKNPTRRNPNTWIQGPPILPVPRNAITMMSLSDRTSTPARTTNQGVLFTVISKLQLIVTAILQRSPLNTIPGLEFTTWSVTSIILRRGIPAADGGRIPIIGGRIIAIATTTTQKQL
ncbi:MAG: hypothetical protein WCN98_07415 [Verrucomicrobiaceae bacterium]